MEEPTRAMGVNPSRVAAGVSHLRQFLLRRTGWKMVGARW